MRNTVRASVGVTLILAAIVAAQTSSAAPPGNAHFQRTWERTDKPVADQSVSRTWMWGPEANSPLILEEYEESPGGQRVVQYFDKSRMEITNPGGDPSVIWYVTNGLLSKEMIAGQMQTGDNTYVTRPPASINVAGDTDDLNGPTYATFTNMLALPAVANGSTITQRVNRAGQVTDDQSLASYGVTAAHRLTVPGIDHQVASPFWAFMNSTAPVWENGQLVTAPLFQNPFYATGYPITEAYWANIKVANTQKDVLIQCFERRCLTYTPGNPAGWQVEAGNVGQHYYQWRYAGSNPTPAPTATATNTRVASPTPTNTPTNTPSPTPTRTSTSSGPTCHPSYPDFCIPPPPPDLNCDDFSSSQKPFTVRHNVANPDPHGLDTDKDGVGCESG